MGNLYEYTLLVTKPSQTIDLPQKWDQVRKIKFMLVNYTTQSTLNRFMLINLKGFNNNCWYWDGNVAKQYSKAIGLLPVSNGTQLVDNYSQTWDVEDDTPHDLASFNIECLINGEYNNDISTSNPIYITIRASQ